MTFCERIRKNAQSFMKANGFAFKKGVFYRIENDMPFCMNLEMPTGTVYSNCFVLPLYVPTEFCYMTYGTRLTVGAAERDGGAGNAAGLAGEWMSILSNDIFPCFQTISSPDAFFTQVVIGRFSRRTNAVYPMCSCSGSGWQRPFTKSGIPKFRKSAAST